MVALAEKAAEVRRVLDRYLIEVVEAYGFCPWARASRTGGELAVAILWNTPSPDDWYLAARDLLNRPATRVAMVLAPELGASTAEMRAIREGVSRRIETAGVADFHPDGVYDPANAARLVPFVRRSPDPLLQLVPLDILDSVRTPQPMLTQAELQQALAGTLPPLREDIADRIADSNLARVTRDLAQLEGVLDDIAADRRTSYARVGITVRTIR